MYVCSMFMYVYVCMYFVFFTFKNVLFSAQYLQTSVLVQLTRKRVHIMKNRREINGGKKGPRESEQVTCWTKEIKRPSLPLDTRGQSK